MACYSKDIRYGRECFTLITSALSRTPPYFPETPSPKEWLASSPELRCAADRQTSSAIMISSNIATERPRSLGMGPTGTGDCTTSLISMLLVAHKIDQTSGKIEGGALLQRIELIERFKKKLLAYEGE